MRAFPTACLLILSLAACEQLGLAPEQRDTEAVRVDPRERPEPERVEVRHVLISFAGADLPGVTRSKEKAAEMAERVYRAALDGRDFDELMRLYSDDGAGGHTYKLTNWGVARLDPSEMERGRMVREFHRAAFSLEVNEIALVPFDESGSPLGWHIIQRIN